MSGGWPVFGYDPGHTGHGTDVSRPEGPVDELWRHHFDGKAAWEAPVVDGRGNAFVHVKMTQVRAPNFRAIGSDGGLVWALRTGPGWGPGAPSPTLADGRVILPDAPESWVVESDSGGRCYETTFHASGVDHPYSTVVDGRIHVGFRTFDLATGEELWAFETDNPEYRVVGPSGDVTLRTLGPEGRTAAVADETVYVAGRVRKGETRYVAEEDLDGEESDSESSLVANTSSAGELRADYDERGHVHALDAADGTLKWETQFETPVRDPTPTVVADGTVYVFDAEQSLRAFDADNGEERWTAAFDGESVSGWRPAVANDRAFVGSRDELHALDVADGSDRWRIELDDDDVAGPPAVVDGVVHVSDTGGVVYAIDVTGEERWRVDVDTQLRTGPVVANGRLYVAGHELICLGDSE